MFPGTNIIGGSLTQDFELQNRLDSKVIADALDVIDGKKPNVELSYEIHNFDRAFGATLSYEISR